MMRSMYSGVAGLKVHQTKMDVIGNNIANVNTVGFKSSNVNFSDVLYQTTQNASGASEEIGLTGRNAKQIGIGSQVASITTTVATTEQGSDDAETTTKKAGTNNDKNNIAQTGDNGMIAAFAVCAVAAGAFIVLSKKKEA